MECVCVLMCGCVRVCAWVCVWCVCAFVRASVFVCVYVCVYVCVASREIVNVYDLLLEQRNGLGDDAIEMDERNSNCGDGEEGVDRAASPTALLSHNTYATINEQTKYGKSLRHFTREALPRLDNYRNILSIQAGHRPTLEELHNATIQDKVIFSFYFLSTVTNIGRLLYKKLIRVILF